MKIIPTYTHLTATEIRNIKTALKYAKENGIDLATDGVKVNTMVIYNDRIERQHYDGYGRPYIRNSFFTVVEDVKAVETVETVETVEVEAVEVEAVEVEAVEVEAVEVEAVEVDEKAKIMQAETEIKQRIQEYLKEDKKYQNHLDLSYLGLTTIPKGLENMPNLTSLDLSGNNLSNLEWTQEMPNLTSLDLSFSQLTSVKGLEKLPNLTSLNLDGNQLTSVSGLELLSTLTSLYLAGNQLTSILELGSLVNLTSLDLAHNKINSFKGIENLTKLTSLNVGNNPAKVINWGTLKISI